MAKEMVVSWNQRKGQSPHQLRSSRYVLSSEHSAAAI